jgi:hypothetical protein
MFTDMKRPFNDHTSDGGYSKKSVEILENPINNHISAGGYEQ